MVQSFSAPPLHLTFPSLPDQPCYPSLINHVAVAHAPRGRQGSFTQTTTVWGVWVLYGAIHLIVPPPVDSTLGLYVAPPSSCCRFSLQHRSSTQTMAQRSVGVFRAPHGSVGRLEVRLGHCPSPGGASGLGLCTVQSSVWSRAFPQIAPAASH